MSPFTPPNACGGSPDPSRLAQQSLKIFWSWTPWAPLLGLKSPWLEIWGPHLKSLGVLTKGAYAPGMAFNGENAPQTTAEIETEAEAAPALEAQPAPKAKAVKAKASPKAEAAQAEVVEAAPVLVEAPAAAKAKRAAKKPVDAVAELKAADQDLFNSLELAPTDEPVEAAGETEPSLQESFATTPEAVAASVSPEAVAEAAPEPVKPEPTPLEAAIAAAPEAEPVAPVVEAAPEAQVEAAAVEPQLESALALEGADDLTRVEGVGPATARRLQEQGVRRYADLAALTPEALIEIRRVGTLTITEDQAREILASAANLARPH